MQLRCMRTITPFVVALLMGAPLVANAANVFGGSVGAVVPCPFNASTWTTIGAPRGGIYIWTPFTHMYPRGLPKPGGYALGLYGIPYFCIVLIFPLIVFPGIAVVMSGTS